VTPRAQLSDRSDTAALDERNRNAEALPFELQQKTITQKEFLSFRTLSIEPRDLAFPGQDGATGGPALETPPALWLEVVGQYFRVGQRKFPMSSPLMLDAISTNETRFFFASPVNLNFSNSASCRNGLPTPNVVRAHVKSACGAPAAPLAGTVFPGHDPAPPLPPSAGWEVEIVATDLSTQVLETARSATWDFAKSAEIPDHYLKAFMLRGFGDQKGKMKAGNEIRSLIHFSRLNLNEANYPVAGKFDLIFCRNVLIYFDLETRTQVVQRLVKFLSPEGFLFVGHAESLHTMSGLLRRVIPTVYTQMPKAEAAG